LFLLVFLLLFFFFFFQAEDGIRDRNVTGVQTCALPICSGRRLRACRRRSRRRCAASLVSVRVREWRRRAIPCRRPRPRSLPRPFRRRTRLLVLSSLQRRKSAKSIRLLAASLRTRPAPAVPCDFW